MCFIAHAFEKTTLHIHRSLPGLALCISSFSWNFLLFRRRNLTRTAEIRINAPLNLSINYSWNPLHMVCGGIGWGRRGWGGQKIWRAALQTPGQRRHKITWGRRVPEGREGRKVERILLLTSFSNEPYARQNTHSLRKEIDVISLKNRMNIRHPLKATENYDADWLRSEHHQNRETSIFNAYGGA